jgi:23S rRNA pseudouridine1911/1915/1917 synthase
MERSWHAVSYSSCLSFMLLPFLYSLIVLRTLEASAADRGKRLDLFLQERLPQYSRSRLQSWVKSGRVTVNSIPQKASFTLRGGETVAVEPAELPSLRAFAEEIPLDILYQDSNLIAVNKPAGIAVHAGAGRHSGTLVNALLHHFQSLSSVGGDERPGIVHRLDRETSGVLIVARTDAAHRHLAAQFANREVVKIYYALVEGELKQAQGRIESFITRDPVRRTRMTSRLGHGRPALTEYKVLERLPRRTLLEVRIGTGRTHQIRVHLASIRHPVAGDNLYGASAAPYGRFFLHAGSIRFRHPSSGKPFTVEAPLPPDLQGWLADLRAGRIIK